MYEAVPISGAHDQLKKRWDSVYEAISKPPAEKQQPLYNLLPGGEEELIRVGGVVAALCLFVPFLIGHCSIMSARPAAWRRGELL